MAYLTALVLFATCAVLSALQRAWTMALLAAGLVFLTLPDTPLM